MADSDAPLSAAQQLTLRSALAALGATPDAVAASLAAAGVTAPRGDYEDSPVGRYLNRLLRAAGQRPLAWTVGYAEAIGRYPAHRDARVFPAPQVRIPLPPPVRGFLQAFDVGRYPALVGRAVRA